MDIPHECPRGLNNCIALSNIISDDKTSFFCCGENNGDNRIVKTDIYTICFKGEFRDEINHNDKRDLIHLSSDLIHLSSVIVRSLAVVEKSYDDKNDWSPWDNK